MAARPPAGDDQGALDQLEAVLADAVSRRMVADVPVGSFLSGGIDSSLVTALAQAGSTEQVRTFTVGFAGQGLDEADHAEAVARHLGTAHTRMELTADDALNLVPHLGRYYDEPFADPSQLPTLLMCREASRHVTVALSGDGGDEAFGGYRRYTAGAVLARRVLPLPRRLRGAAAGALDAVPGTVWDGIGRGAQRLRPAAIGPDFGTRAHKLARLLTAGSSREVYMSLVSAWDDAETVVVGAPDSLLERSATPLWPGGVAGRGDDGLGHALDAARRDAGQGRPGQHGLRPRGAAAPGRPQGGGGGLESAAVTAHPRRGGQAGPAPPPGAARAPPPVRPAQDGFDPPLGAWLRGPLRDWAEDLLAASRLRDQGFFDPVAVRACWDAHQAGRPGLEYPLWAVLAFEAWLDETGAST